MALIHPIEHPVVDGIRVGRVNKKGGYHLTASVILYRIGDTLIDTGPSRERDVVLAYAKEQSIRRVLMTHHHEDHSGNGAALQSELGIDIYSHPLNHKRLAAGLEMGIVRKITFGSVPAFRPKPLADEIELENNYRLQALHMPGHTDDLVCFYEPNEGLLFTGDLYVTSQMRYATVGESVSDWVSSLEHALSLDFDTLFCAHRAVVTNGKEVLAKKLDAINSLCEAVELAHRRGDSVKQITRSLLGREDLSGWLSMMYMSKKKLVESCLEHLAA